MSLFPAILAGHQSSCCGPYASAFYTDLTLEGGIWVWGEGGEAYDTSMNIWATYSGEPSGSGPAGVMQKSDKKSFDVPSWYRHHVICEFSGP